VITRFAHSATDRSQLLIADHGCERFTIEAYQTLQTNLQLTANERCKSVYLITSPGPGEGKTVTAANLAISMTKADLRVVLVDGDLRRPQIHETFGVDNAVGLTTFLTADPSDDNPDFKNSDECKNGLAYLIQETAIPGLSVISSGLQCEHPNEMLGSSQLTHFFEMLRNAPDIDVVVIDSPPCLLVPDGFRLAEVANAQIILILEAGHTQRSIALKAKERFALVGKDISGIVLNKIGRSEEDYYGYRRSYQYYDSGLKTRSFLLKSSVFSRVFAKRH
jgi:capsular exopolysaccharide synthesis family protein